MSIDAGYQGNALSTTCTTLADIIRIWVTQGC